MLKSVYSTFLVLIGSLLFQSFDTQQSNGFNQSEESKLYSQIANVNLYTTQDSFKISELYNQSPILIAFIFTRCYGVCNPFLLQLYEQVNTLQTNKRFRILVVSFDPKDKPSDMNKLSERYHTENNSRWIFATTNQISQLIQSVDFNPKWDSVRQQFDHESLLVGVNENGYITKKLIGIRGTNDLQTMIQEINNEFIPSYPIPGSEMQLSCFNYNPINGKRTPAIGLFIMISPAILGLLLILFITYKGNKWRQKQMK